MSKVDELRVKYPRVSEATFTKLVGGDRTPTKKYLEYMLKQWTVKLERKQNITSAEALIIEVNLFDSLLSYNDKKDIYSPEYNSFSNLKSSNQKYWEIKEEKSFNRDDHARVVYEDDEILFIEPKTHKGSLKYGANTRWCTASKGNPNTFESYTKRGCLVYLIDKTNSKNNNYSKLAFINLSGSPLSGQIEIYNQSDSSITETTVINNGWKCEKITELVLRYRAYHVEWARLKQSRDEVDKTINIVKNLDLSSFNKHLNVLLNYDENEFKWAKDILDKFIGQVEENLSKIKY